jgi:glycine hydroxymethyltransferase
MNIIAAKAQCFLEARTPEFKEYILNVRANAKALAKGLQEEGYKIATGGTDSHIVLVDLSDKPISGREAADLLEDNGITCNKNGIPNDPRNFVETSGIRLGTAAETTKGMPRYEFEFLGRRIAKLLTI